MGVRRCPEWSPVAHSGGRKTRRNPRDLGRGERDSNSFRSLSEILLDQGIAHPLDRRLQLCQRRLNSDPLWEWFADLILTHPVFYLPRDSVVAACPGSA